MWTAELLPAEYLMSIHHGRDRLQWESTLADIYDLPERPSGRMRPRLLAVALIFLVALVSLVALILAWL